MCVARVSQKKLLDVFRPRRSRKKLKWNSKNEFRVEWINKAKPLWRFLVLFPTAIKVFVPFSKAPLEWHSGGFHISTSEARRRKAGNKFPYRKLTCHSSHKVLSNFHGFVFPSLSDAFTHRIRFPSIINHKSYISPPTLSTLQVVPDERQAQVPNLFPFTPRTPMESHLCIMIFPCAIEKSRRQLMKYWFGFSRMKPIKRRIGEPAWKGKPENESLVPFCESLSPPTQPAARYLAKFLPCLRH